MSSHVLVNLTGNLAKLTTWLSPHYMSILWMLKMHFIHHE